MGRRFCGVDLEKSYGSLMWNEGDFAKKQEYALLREFCMICRKMERGIMPGMIVMDRDGRVYTIIDIKGWNIEEKEYWLQRMTSNGIEKKTATEIYPLKWWVDERDRIRDGIERVPKWFRITDAVMRRNTK